MLAVGLGARSTHRRTLGAIEQPELNSCPVRDPADQAVERIDFPHEMAFAEATYGRVTRHGSDSRKAHGEKRRARPHPGCRGRRFAAGMATADHDDIELLP